MNKKLAQFLEYVPSEYLYEKKTSEQGASCNKCHINLEALMLSKVPLLWVYERKPEREFEASKYEKVQSKEEY